MRFVVVTALSLTIALWPAAAAERTSAKPFAYVTVVGAPGDGDQALAAALSRQLAARGFEPAPAVQANVYEVQGTVRVAPAAKGKESIAIIWVVLGPDGKQLGITRQTRDVRKGSLDKRWGNAADAAAGAAAEDIAKFVPR